MNLNPTRQFVLAGALVFLVALGLYTHTLSPAFHPDDSPETITAGATLSIQHPPGYPLHSVLGRLAVLVGPGGAAFSVNGLAAFFGALAIALAMLCLFEIMWELASWESQRKQHLLTAAAMALALTCTQSLWFQATIAKGGIYTLNIALSFATLLCILKFRQGGPQFLRLAGLFFGLGFANHWTSQVVLLPGYALILSEARLRRNDWPRPAELGRLVFWPILFTALGLSLYIYLPIRSHLGAPLVWGDSQSLQGFLWVFNRSQYAGLEAGKSLAVFVALLSRIGMNVVADYTWVGVGGLLAGWLLLFLKRPLFAAGLFLLPLTLALAVAWKANPPPDAYFIIDPYLLPVHLGLGLGLAGLAGEALIRRYLAPVFLGAALALGAWQYRTCDHAFDLLGYDYIRNLLLSTPAKALLYCEGDSNTAGPFYERYVRKHRLDVTLIPVVLSDYEWMRRSLALQDPTLKQSPSPLGPGGNMAWMAEHNPGRPAVWTNSYSKGWANEGQLLHRGLVLVRQAKLQAFWTVAQLQANDVWPAYALRGVFKPYQRSQDPISVRLVQDNYIESQARLAQAYMLSKAYKEAGKKFRLLGRLKPGWSPAWVQAGNAEYQVHDLAAAGKDWLRAVEEDPDSAEAQANLGLFYYDSKNFDQALSQANRALKLNPKLPNAIQLRDLSLQRVGGYSAPTALSKPSGPTAQSYAMEGDRLAASDPARSLAAYDKAVAGGFANASVHRNRGVMLMRLTRTVEAAQALRLAIGMEPKNPELYRYLGIMLYNSGDKAGGTKAIQESAALDPKNKDTQALLQQLGITK